MDKLKDCPFCGGSDTLGIDSNTDRGDGFEIFCNYAIGGCGSNFGFSPTIKELTIKWNTRPIEDKLTKALNEAIDLIDASNISNVPKIERLSKLLKEVF